MLYFDIKMIIRSKYIKGKYYNKVEYKYNKLKILNKVLNKAREKFKKEFKEVNIKLLKKKKVFINQGIY
jgi:hypothetical protein